MNACIERMRKYENFGRKNHENGVSDRKIWLWKIWKAKWSFWKGMGVFVGFFSGSCEVWEFSGIFGGFL
jgi:hypothetical protein